MKKILYLLLITNSFCFSQNNQINSLSNLDVDKVSNYCKVWGFLKFYHPNVAQGKFNWDEEFKNQLKLINKTKNTEELSYVFKQWITRLGVIKEYKKQEKPKLEYFTKNLDLSWINENPFFDSDVSELLNNIKINRFRGKSYYIDIGKNGNIIMTNEGSTSLDSFPNSEERLLCLCKYWNSVEYFYPYKYLIDTDWTGVLKEMIPRFYHAKNEAEFELLMLETVVKTNDGHSFFKTQNTVNYFGDYFFPAEIKIINNEAVISKIPNDSIGSVNDLKIGDIITEINGENINDIINRKYKYISGSNDVAKLRDTYYFLANGKTETVNIKILRSNELLHKPIKRYDYSLIYKREIEGDKIKILYGNIGYINMEYLNLKDVNAVMNKLEETKGLIIDIRNYPKFLPYQLAGRFIQNETKALKILFPDLSYPGRFVFKKNKTVTPVKKYYNKKVIILVDENTQSRAEFSAMLFQTSPNVITLGSKTAGANGDITYFNFSSKYKSLISGTGIYYPDGEANQRNGIKIDIEITPTIKGIQELKDEQLLKAIDVINQSL